MRDLRRSAWGADVQRLQQAINTRLRNRGAPDYVVKPDGELGPATCEAMRSACWLLGYPTSKLADIRSGSITSADQMFVLNPGRRTPTELETGRKRTAAHRTSPTEADGSEGFEPQPIQKPGERVPDLVTDVEVTDASADQGIADNNDDSVVFDPPDERPKYF